MKDRNKSAMRRTTNTTNKMMMTMPITRPPTSPEVMLLPGCPTTTTLVMALGGMAVLPVVAVVAVVAVVGVVGSTTSREQGGTSGESSRVGHVESRPNLSLPAVTTAVLDNTQSSKNVIMLLELNCLVPITLARYTA